MERQPYQRYTETFKLTVLNYYYEHGEDRKQTLLEFKIDHSCLRDWLKRYESKENVVSLLQKIEDDMAGKYEKLPRDAAEAARAYYKLQKELEQERLRSEAFSKMIDFAEEEFKIARPTPIIISTSGRIL